MIKKEKLAKFLTYSGSIPFLFLTYLVFVGKDFIFDKDIYIILMPYSAIILSFVSGLQFGYAILRQKVGSELLILTNIIALIACLSILTEIKQGIIIMISCYIFNLLIDIYVYKKSVIAKWFLILRFNITIIVCASLIAIYYLMPF